MQENNSCQIGTRNASKGNELWDRLKNDKDFTRRDRWGMEREQKRKAEEAYLTWSNGVKVCDGFNIVHFSFRGK